MTPLAENLSYYIEFWQNPGWSALENAEFLHLRRNLRDELDGARFGVYNYDMLMHV